MINHLENVNIKCYMLNTKTVCFSIYLVYIYLVYIFHPTRLLNLKC